MRQQLAEKLKFTSYAAFTLDIRMAKEPKNVEILLQSLTKKLLEKGK